MKTKTLPVTSVKPESLLWNPSIVLHLTCLFIFFINLTVAYLSNSLILLAPIFVLQTVVIFVDYIIAHEAAHKSFSENKTINELALFTVWAVFLINPYMYRAIHLRHHADTNGPTDPDKFTAGGSLAARIGKSLLLYFHYPIYAWKHLTHKPRMKFHIISTPLVIILIAAISFAFGKTAPFLIAWLFPIYLAISALAYLETAAVHHPASDRTRIGNTAILKVPKLLQYLMGNHNYHLVHHLKPRIPWYKIGGYWAENQDELIGRGAKVIDLSGNQVSASKFLGTLK